TRAVREAFARPLVLLVEDARRIRLEPRALGARPNVPKAIRRARVARPGAVVPLDVSVSRARIRGYVERLARTLDREPVDARVVLQGVKPRALPAREGRRLRVLANARALRFALARNEREPIRLAFDVLRPEVRSVELETAVVILRASKRLLFFREERLVRWFRVATGLASYPTPLGRYEIVTKQRNPWWYPPPSGWAAGKDPVPPGPGNPLGTRWMGISAPYVGIHGTPDAASIGYSASHGCIRMRISDAEWLFERVEVGTPVFILER
ncbi:MAG TPA: L,D-transpeptidase family protein, partial [Gaiellaceae bacterium]|nr:L,D-transpeptidase family protein [Gaiellaceae bacterium]